MNFALLGDDPDVLPLLRAIAAHPEHALLRAAHVDKTLEQVLRTAPAVRVVPRWDELLLDDEVDGAIIAGHDDEVLAGAKQLASAGKALILFPQAAQDPAFVYELSLIRDDLGITLFPVFPLRVHPLVLQLSDLLERAAIGRILRLQLDRWVHRPAESGMPRLLSQRQVDAELLADVDLLRMLGGDYNQVTALRSGAGRDISRATVTLARRNLPEATWTIEPTAGASEWRLTVRGETGTATLYGGPEAAELRLQIAGAEAPVLAADDSFDAGAAELDRFEAARSGQPVQPDWTDVTRAFEVVEAAHRSIRRRRTIDLYFETTSERSVFKTQMTAIGCGVLVYTFLAVLAYLLFAALFNVDPLLLRISQIVLFLPLVLFLVLQFLVLVAKPSASEPTPEPLPED